MFVAWAYCLNFSASLGLDVKAGGLGGAANCTTGAGTGSFGSDAEPHLEASSKAAADETGGRGKRRFEKLIPTSWG